MITREYKKFNKLLKQLQQFLFDMEVNKARRNFILLSVIRLCHVQTVNIEKLSLHFNNKVKPASSVKRMNRFLAKYDFNLDYVAKFIMSILPMKPPFKLLVDRTDWKFGKTSINILMLSIAYESLSIPIIFTMLDNKGGNSKSEDRIDLLERFINLFGTESIECIIGDREFVGEKWLKYLNNRQICYYLRIKENFYAIDNTTGKRIQVKDLFAHLKQGETAFKKNSYKIGDVSCYLSASKIKNKDGQLELQIIASYNKPQRAIKIYKERWQIESMFRAFKTSGFNLEDTHITDFNRISKLLGLVMLAYTISYLVGLHNHQKVKPIRICKHKRLAKSFVKYGLEVIVVFLNNHRFEYKFNTFNFLSCT